MTLDGCSGHPSTPPLAPGLVSWLPRTPGSTSRVRLLRSAAKTFCPLAEISMPGTVERRQQIEQLIAENETLEQRLAELQRDPAPSPTEIRDDQRAYHDWYARAQHYVQDGERNTFRDMYEGGQFIRRISAFLTALLEINSFHDPSDKNSITPKWAHPFSDTCLPALVKQRQILAQALHETTGVDSVLNELATVFRRLPEFISALGAAANPNVRAPTVGNERDLQVLTDGILRLLYRNVLAEDAVPKKSGARRRRCAAPRGASRAALSLGGPLARARRQTDSFPQISQGSCVTQPNAAGRRPRSRLSSSRPPRQWRPLRAVACDRLRRPLTRRPLPRTRHLSDRRTGLARPAMIYGKM
jgi:hypothetical protein